jgi:putative protein kinase ArgK-like GTPase of G3E family
MATHHKFANVAPAEATRLRPQRELEPKGIIAKRRQQQSLEWLSDLIHDELRRRFHHDPRVAARLPGMQQALLRGDMTAVRTAKVLLAAHEGRGHSTDGPIGAGVDEEHSV